MENTKRKYSMKSDAKARRARVITRHEATIHVLKNIGVLTDEEKSKLNRLQKEVEVLKTRI
jgi:hypothetical protein